MSILSLRSTTLADPTDRPYSLSYNWATQGVPHLGVGSFAGRCLGGGIAHGVASEARL